MKRVLSLLAVAALAASGAPSKAAGSPPFEATPGAPRIVASERAVVEQMLREAEKVSRATRCRSDAAVTEAERASVTAAGLTFQRLLNANDGAAVYALLTAEMKDQFAPAAVRETIGMLHPFAPYDAPRVTSLYVLDAREVGGFGKVACVDAQGRAAMVSVMDDPRQAHLVMETDDSEQLGWALTLWLVERDGRWQWNGFDVHNTRAGRLISADALVMARRERAAGHEPAAVVLYRSAIGTSNRGGHFTTPDHYVALRELEQWKPGLAAITNLAFSWADRGVTYRADSLSVTPADGKLWLQMVRLLPTWPGDAAVETDNQAMLASFRDTKMGGTTGVFEGFEVRATTPDGKHVRITRSTTENTGRRA